MTTTTTRQLPWLKYSQDVDRQVEAGIAREQARRASGAVVNGAPTYRDQATREDYTVGYGGERSYSRPAAPARDYTPSEAQVRFLNNLLVEREHSYTEEQIAEGRADWRKIRPMLDTLKAAPRKPYQAPVQVAAPAPQAPQARLDFSSIADGNYALPGEGDEIKFYRVSTNNGYKNVQVRASDTLWPLRTKKQEIAVLHKIVEFGLDKSQMLFATKLERCYKCYRSLTDADSRARGMGDECASK